MMVGQFTGGFFARLGLLLERTHFFTFGKPHTDGVRSRWTRDLEPVGDAEVMTGTLVELVSTFEARHGVSEASRLRFDLLEEDWFLTGGADDVVENTIHLERIRQVLP
jgi:hypothetical protein